MCLSLQAKKVDIIELSAFINLLEDVSNYDIKRALFTFLAYEAQCSLNTVYEKTLRLKNNIRTLFEEESRDFFD